jgi:hypothetical protein
MWSSIRVTRIVISIVIFMLATIQVRGWMIHTYMPPSARNCGGQKISMMLRTSKDAQHIVPSNSRDLIDNDDDDDKRPWRRRNEISSFVKTMLLSVVLPSALLLGNASPSVALAADNKPSEFVNVGIQAPPPEGTSAFVTLANGVKIKDIQVGKGDTVVTPTSRVEIQCSGRLLNLNGVSFYNTKNNNPDGFGALPLVIELGKGQAVPGLEAGLVGMKKSGIRRIIVPQDLAYNKFPDLEPKPLNPIDQRALDSVVKNPRRDGAILFDVQLERVK